MKRLSFYLIILTAFTFNLSKAMQNSRIHPNNTVQDSIYKIWKFKRIELPSASGFIGGMGITDKYDIWDLTKKGVLRYSIADSPAVFQSVRYKLINNAIVLQFPDKQTKADDMHSKTDYVQFKSGDLQFKIKELTSTVLKVIMHVKFNQGGKIHEGDLIELDFEVKE